MSSPQTRAVCQKYFGFLRAKPDPALTPAEALAQMRRKYDAIAPGLPADIKRVGGSLGGVSGVWLYPPNDDGTTILFLHGGGFMIGSSESHSELAARIAQASDARAFVGNYRLAPEHPSPAALEDSLAMIRDLIASGTDPSRIVMMGDSSGGGLALSTLLALRDSGGSLPGAVVALSAWTDMTVSGKSVSERAELDPIVSGDIARVMAEGYVPEANERENPLVSPVFGDYRGFPPMLMQVGTSETLYDDTIRVVEAARRAGVDVELREFDDMVHVFQLLWFELPEGKRAISEIGRFVRARAAVSSIPS